MSWRQAFAKMIGVPEHQSEDALHSEGAARAVLSRRDLLAAGAGLAAGSAFSFASPVASPLPLIVSPWAMTTSMGVAQIVNRLPGLPFYAFLKGGE